MAERSRWLLLVLALIMGFGGLTYGGILYTGRVDEKTRRELTRVENERQHDLCELMRVFDDPDAPPPATDRGRAQVAAIRDYVIRRC